MVDRLEECSFESLNRFGLLALYIRQSLLSQITSDEELSEELKTLAKRRFCDELGINGEQALEAFRCNQLLSAEDLQTRIELPLKIEQYSWRHFRGKAESRFLERKSYLDQVVYSLIRIPGQGLALELYLQLKEEGASFSELAARYSNGHEATTRGVIGPCPLGQAHPALVERLRTASVGEVGEPFQIEHWWIIYRVESFTPSVFDDIMAKQMANELLEAHIAQLSDEIMQQLRERHSNSYNQMSLHTAGNLR